MRKLMRLVVSDGFGKTAEVPGYFIGGKTGTAEKSGKGGYKKKANIQAFTSVFPMNAPRYAVSVVVEHGGGGSAVAAPIARDAILRALSDGLPPLSAYPANQRTTIETQQKNMKLRKLDPASAESSRA
jgi:cell division protein FtsI/penicillin-binding protein 2